MAFAEKTLPILLTLQRSQANLMDCYAEAVGQFSGPRFLVLRALANYPGGWVSQKALIELSEIDRSTLSEMLPRMKRDCHITMKTDPKDKRANLVRIAPLGKRRYTRTVRIIGDIDRKFEKAFPSIHIFLNELAAFKP